jgi:hypothetical protein
MFVFKENITATGNTLLNKESSDEGNNPPKLKQASKPKIKKQQYLNNLKAKGFLSFSHRSQIKNQL